MGEPASIYQSIALDAAAETEAASAANEAARAVELARQQAEADAAAADKAMQQAEAKRLLSLQLTTDDLITSLESPELLNALVQGFSTTAERSPPYGSVSLFDAFFGSSPEGYGDPFVRYTYAPLTQPKADGLFFVSIGTGTTQQTEYFYSSDHLEAAKYDSCIGNEASRGTLHSPSDIQGRTGSEICDDFYPSHDTHVTHDIKYGVMSFRLQVGKTEYLLRVNGDRTIVNDGLELSCTKKCRRASLTEQQAVETIRAYLGLSNEHLMDYFDETSGQPREAVQE